MFFDSIFMELWYDTKKLFSAKKSQDSNKVQKRTLSQIKP